MSGTITWSDEDSAALIRLRAEGLNSVEIGRRLGRSKGAILGRADRMGLKWAKRSVRALPIKPSPERHADTGVIAAIKINQHVRANEPEPVAPFVDRPGSVAFVDLKPCHCRWPLGRSPYRFCGHDRAVGEPYCAEHVATSQGRGTPSERNALKRIAAE